MFFHSNLEHSSMHSLPTFMTSLTTAQLFTYCLTHRNSGGKLSKIELIVSIEMLLLFTNVRSFFIKINCLTKNIVY